MRRLPATIVVCVFAAACGAADPPPLPPPVVFEGFGLGDLSAAESVARALPADPATQPQSPFVPLDMVVRGPGRGVPEITPLAAEVRSRIEGINVAAGLEGDAAALAQRSPFWTGRIGVAATRPTGLESLELRTRLESRAGAERLRLELGPRIERRLRRGARVFIDGTASAEAARTADERGWQLPGTSTADSVTALGASANAGIIR